MAKEFVLETFVFKMLAKVVGGLVLFAMCLYPLDFAVWRIRVAVAHDGRGGLGSVQVSHVVAAEEKGNKEEYFNDGTSAVDCSKSLFPQGGVNACWWQERNKEVTSQY